MAFVSSVPIASRSHRAQLTSRRAASPAAATARMVQAGPESKDRRAVLQALCGVIGGGAALLGGAAGARADHTLQAAKLSFDRYHPRMLTAVETLGQIGTAANKGDKDAAAALITDALFAVKAKRAFTIYATSFSDNYLGEKSKILLKCVDRMYDQLDLVAKGEDMGEHFDEAVKAIKKYYDVARLPKADLASL